MEPHYVPPFDFSTLGPDKSAKWNATTQEWEVHDMDKPPIWEEGTVEPNV